MASSPARPAFRRLYRELLALSRASSSPPPQAPAAGGAAVEEARAFARKLLRQGLYVGEGEQERREYADHVLDAMTKRVAFARSMVPLWRRPRPRADAGAPAGGGRTTTYAVDGGRLVEVGRGGGAAREERRKDCKPTRFASMAEARQEHDRLLRRQYFGRDPGPNWKGVF